MSDLHFEWDARKAGDNRRKHGVSFEEAQTALQDENALVIHDPDHSEAEDRFVLLGMTRGHGSSWSCTATGSGSRSSA